MATSAKDAALVRSEPPFETPFEGEPFDSLRASLGKQGERSWPQWVLWLKHLLGLDRAIAYTVLARGFQILGSTGTVLLILRFLTPVEQGYYYTLLSLVSLQAVFELGFSFVILQMAAHECARLTLHAEGRVEGDAVAHARLASILQKAFRWYLVAAVILCVSLLPAGAYFFSRHARPLSSVEWHGSPVAWHGPWAVAVFATAFLFLLNPFCSFLEGCGQVWQVGRMRLGQALLGAAMSWGALLAHHGLYAPGAVIIGYAAAGLGFLYSRRKLCLGLLLYPAREQSVSWRNEIWPFQWKIAVSWACAYFTIQIFTPVLFAYRGAAEAGQFGMSLGITASLSILMISWMSTKATPFGQMIARGELQQLRALFFRTLRQALSLMVAAAALCQLAVIALHYLFPRLAARMASPQVFVLLLLTCISSFVVQSMAIYLRSFKREPFLIQSVVIAALTVLLSFVTVKGWGIAGISASYLTCTGAIGLILGANTFRSWCAGMMAECEPGRYASQNGVLNLNERSYRRAGLSEMLRGLGRGVDFLFLLVTLRMRRRLPSFSELRKMSFVELGPGPTRMGKLKGLFFRKVFFIDQCDFGIPDPQLRVANLDQCADATKIIALCDLSANEGGLFLFADHCIEHLREETALRLLGSLADQRFAACFRVPNIESPAGQKNFAADTTHHSSFDEGLRSWLGNLGFVVSPWIRWYRSNLLVKLMFKSSSAMSLADEIVVSANFS